MFFLMMGILSEPDTGGAVDATEAFFVSTFLSLLGGWLFGIGFGLFFLGGKGAWVATAAVLLEWNGTI